MSAPPRVAADLNRALHELFARDDRVRLVGEDLLDPYGGAFKVAKGLSTAYPDRVLSTPISEGGITGVGAGLALCGDPTIVEVMFGDFLTLGFDQLVNFAAKSVSMYGRRVPVPLLVRCPVGGRRGYGPTHSQSLQKHLVGVPDLDLYELSPFHDPGDLIGAALDRAVPSVLFEDKVLYTRRVYRDGVVDDLFGYRVVGGRPGWAHVSAGPVADRVVIAAGGVVDRVLEAARTLHASGLSVRVLVPGRLYPLDLEPVLPLLAGVGHVAVVEEGTSGGSWGEHVAALLHERLWGDLRQPVRVLTSAASIIPSAPHLEDRVLLGADDVVEALGGAGPAPAPPGPADGRSTTGTPLVTPKLNNNDTTYQLVAWLHEDGARVSEGEPVLELETSKAVEEITAPADGHLWRAVPVGAELGVGEVLGHLTEQASRPDGTDPAQGPAPAQAQAQAQTPAPTPAHVPAPAPTRPSAPTHVQAPTPAPAPTPAHVPSALAKPAPAGELVELDRAQRGTAAVVTRGHREIPAAFTVVRVDVDAVLDGLDRVGERTGATVGLPEALVRAIARAHADFPLFFATLVDDRSVRLADAPRVGVTLDPDGTLYVAVVDGAHEMPLDDLADALMDLRMKAVRHDFAAHELDGANITLSLNQDPGVVFVQPLVLWPQLCMVSAGAVRREAEVGEDGAVRARRVVDLGLAYDHRVLNGSAAVAFLTRLRAALEDPAALLGE